MRLIDVIEADIVPARNYAVIPVGKEAVLEVEKQIKQLPQIELPLKHEFAPGVYARSMFIPKGTILAGKIHKYAHFNVVLKGDIEILTEHGVKRIKAPAMFVSPAGIKRAGYAYEDTVWVTIHATDETDPDKIEAAVTVDDYAELNKDVIEGDFQE